MALSSLWSCKADLDRQNEKPISKKKMVDILYDLHLSDGINRNYFSNNPFNLNVNEKSTYKFILDKYNISDSLLASSMIYYMSFPKMYEEIYAEVVQRFSMKNEELKNIEEEKRKEQQRLTEMIQKQIRDSLAGIFIDSVSGVFISFKTTADSLSLSLDSLLKSQDSIVKNINSLRKKAVILHVNIDSLLNSVDSTYLVPIDTLINTNTE